MFSGYHLSAACGSAISAAFACPQRVCTTSLTRRTGCWSTSIKRGAPNVPAGCTTVSSGENARGNERTVDTPKASGASDRESLWIEAAAFWDAQRPRCFCKRVCAASGGSPRRRLGWRSFARCRCPCPRSDGTTVVKSSVLSHGSKATTSVHKDRHQIRDNPVGSRPRTGQLAHRFGSALDPPQRRRRPRPP